MSAAIKYMPGDVLQLISIVGQTSGALERTIGFHNGRLSRGFDLWLLDDIVGLSDFEWGGATSLPGNWFPTVAEGANLAPEEQWAKVEDVKRWQFYRSAGFDADRGDYAFDLWKGQQAALLNDRTSSSRIVKVVPRIPHDSGMPSYLQYPKAKGITIKQWKLRTPLRFIFQASVGIGEQYLGGGSGSAVVAASSTRRG